VSNTTFFLKLLTAAAFTWSAQVASAAKLVMPVTASEAASAVPSTLTLSSPHDFKTLNSRLTAAIDAQKMGLVAQASASVGAAGRGVKIPGNAVVMVFRNDYAVRMLKASVLAGIEAPIRIYLTENTNGTTNLSYRLPSSIFAPYHNAELDVMAKELDPIFERIARDAVAP
jgi:uncharacterized protein (DUF302 family)